MDERVVDAGASEVLEQVLADWLRAGPLSVLLQLIEQVWRVDLARHQPSLGDDAQTLGIMASRNLCNLTVERLRGLPGVTARDRRTLEVLYGGRLLHVGKAPSESLTWDVASMDWSSSEVRDDAARANSEAYLPAQGTLFEFVPYPGMSRVATALAHLHLTWQGFPDGTTRAWLGFPRFGIPPWFAVSPLQGAFDPHDAAAQEDAAPAAPRGLDAVQLPAPVLGVVGEELARL